MSKSSRKKNLFLPLLSTIFILSIWILIFFFVPPESPLAPLAFLAITSLVVFFLVSIAFKNTRRGILSSVLVLLLMLMNYYGAGNYLNAILLLGVFLSLDFYLSKRDSG